jgi:enoyl-CoA hydratase/carnithine racemase
MPIRYEAHDNIVLIVIDRPNKMNALDELHNAQLYEAWRRYEEDPGLRVAVFTGAGTVAFSAGADLKQMIPAFRDQVRAGEEPAWAMGGITADPYGGTKPTIAAVNGHALAGGLELALACDIRLAAPNATFGLAETKWAIIPGAGGTQRLPRTVGLGLAMEMILSAEPIDAATALSCGLVSRIVPGDELVASALSLAKSIAARGPLAVRAARRAVITGLGTSLTEGLAEERRLFLEVMRSRDAIEGSDAFAEKRPPTYIGQ